MFPNGLRFSLRSLLAVDAVTCLGMGIFLTVLAGALARVTLIPEALLFYAGVVLFPVALFMATVALRWHTNRLAGWSVILGNVAWVVASLALVAGMISPNLPGTVFILVQAFAVAVLAWLEYRALSPRTHGAVRARG